MNNVYSIFEFVRQEIRLTGKMTAILDSVSNDLFHKNYRILDYLSFKNRNPPNSCLLGINLTFSGFSG